MIRIHFTYRHVDGPWGGANNFIRALRAVLRQSGRFQPVDDAADDCDVIFMNQLGTGPAGKGHVVTLDEVRRFRAAGRRVVARAVNLNLHAFRHGPKNLVVGWWNDRQTIALLNMADLVVFQSAYQRAFFERAGYRGSRSVVIHNGAPREYWVDHPAPPSKDGPLRVVSSTASPRASKRHDLIARLSLCQGVEVTHLGAWPGKVHQARVRCLGMQGQQAMVTEFARSHAFLHAAVKDPCPNAVFEALCAGLPVVYNPGPGSSAEIVGRCGLPLLEHNVGGTVAQLRQQLPALRDAVLEDRARCSIEHAASRYAEAIECLLASPQITA
jgi:glycosyltransferase involved in cell wall biosynthesis